jgi:hypothetical protein
MRMPDGSEWISAWRTEGAVMNRYSVFVRRKHPFEGICEQTQLDDSPEGQQLPLEERLLDFRAQRVTALAQIETFLGASDEITDLVREVELYLANP